MPQGLNFILLHIPNIAKAVNFYTEKLGLEIKDQMPDFVDTESTIL